MANLYARPVQDLIDQLGRLPGVGPKSAQRIAFHLLKVSKEDAERLAASIVEARAKVTFCTRCFNIAEGAECEICTDARRDTTVVCVVEESRDIVALERTARFRGRYHVLQGAISPIEGIGPQQLRVKELLERLGVEPVEEVILATNPNIEGEATALYLSKLLTPIVTVSRLASGLPVGGDLEYADELTLGAALEARRTVEPDVPNEPAPPDPSDPGNDDAPA
jgi:recombination protein RecR